MPASANGAEGAEVIDRTGGEAPARPRAAAGPWAIRGAAIADERKALSGLRGVAVALVVLSHLGNGGMHVLPGVRLDAIGKAGVWLFFSLSAFLLTSHLSRLLADATRTRWREIARYAVNRFFRIFPLYAIVLVAHWAWGDMTVPQVFRHLALVAGMEELWAIPVEFQYYVVIPFVALMVAALGARITAVALVAALAASMAISVASPAKVFSGDLDVVFRLPAFLAGSLVVLLLPALRARVIESPLFAAAVVLAAAGATAAYRAVVLDVHLVTLAPWVSLLLAVVWGAALVAASRERAPLARVLAARPLVFLGKVSFGVYLWHLFVLRFLMEHSTWPPWAKGWLGVAVSLVIAALTYATVERPGILVGRRLGDALFAKRRPR